MLKRSISLLYTHNFKQSSRLWCSTLQSSVSSSAIKKIENQNSASNSKPATTKNEDAEYKQYFLKNDPDTFGTLSTPAKELLQESHADEGDMQEDKFLENPVPRSRKLRTKQYADIIKTHIRKRQIKEAIDVLEVRMIEQDRIKPENYIYNLIIGVCGRVGYTKQAFKLFNDMKKRDLKPTAGTYTALFNACANSPWLEDGLSRATKLRELMIEKGIISNDTNYNAMIKAFGRCGDLKTAFSLVDEMIENKIPVKGDTINFLMQSCISDKEAGFRHALLVWRKFHNKNIQPNIFSFNLMLKCIRDCNLGDSKTMQNLLQSPEFKLLESGKKNIPKLESSSELVDISVQNNNLDIYNRPNLMAATPCLGNIIQLNEIAKAEDRLLLVGGCSGFLQSMHEFGIKPDIKTYTQLLECIPGTIAAEKALLAAMKKDGIKHDVDFLNMLIKKRSMRCAYNDARDVLSMFKTPKQRPDIITYGVLALGCESKEQAESLINEMKDAGYRMNIEILGAMLKHACIQMNFVFVLDLMELTVREQIKPNKIFIQHLEDLYKRCKDVSQKQKKGSFFHKGFQLFRMRYKTWLQEVQIDPRDEAHPWDQFRKPTETKATNYKDPEVHFKPRIASRYRKKTGTLNQ